MRKLLYIISVLFALGCTQDRLEQVSANIKYLDEKLEGNIDVLTNEITSLEDDTISFIDASEQVAANIEDYAETQEAHWRDLTAFQDSIQQEHLNRFNNDLEALRSIINIIDDTNRQLEEDLELLDNLRLQLVAANQNELDLLLEEIYSLEAEINASYISLEEELYTEFLTLSEESFTEIASIVGEIDGTQDVIELVIQQVLRDKPDYVQVKEIDLPKIGGLLSIPESVYRVEYEVSLNPSIITDNASSTTIATVNVDELILTAIKDNECKDLVITYSDNTTETLTDVICDIDVIASKTVSGTLPENLAPTTVTPTTVTPTISGGYTHVVNLFDEPSAKASFHVTFGDTCGERYLTVIAEGLENLTLDITQSSNGNLLLYQELAFNFSFPSCYPSNPPDSDKYLIGWKLTDSAGDLIVPFNETLEWEVRGIREADNSSVFFAGTLEIDADGNVNVVLRVANT